jgi:hypothetical protein
MASPRAVNKESSTPVPPFFPSPGTPGEGQGEGSARLARWWVLLQSRWRREPSLAIAANTSHLIMSSTPARMIYDSIPAEANRRGMKDSKAFRRVTAPA